jgi:peptidyl-prolyl cis-trans isomerase C
VGQANGLAPIAYSKRVDMYSKPLSLLLLGALLNAQAPVPAKPKVAAKPAAKTPGQAVPLPGPQPPKGLAAPTIPTGSVAVLNGRGFTKSELEEMIRVLVPQNQQAAMMADPKYFLFELGRIQIVAADALANKLPEKSPYKERYWVSNLKELANMQYNDFDQQSFTTEDQQRKFYERNISKYQGAKLRGIYLPYAAGAPTGEGANKTMTEAEAKALGDQIVKEARGGANFVELVKKHTRDEPAKLKDGDYGLIRRADPLPDLVKNAVFALKKDEVTEPVQQANGFYIFQAYEIVSEPFEKVQEDIFKEIKALAFQKYVEDSTSRIQLQILDEGYFKEKAAAAAAAAQTSPTKQPDKK